MRSAYIENKDGRAHPRDALENGMLKGSPDTKRHRIGFAIALVVCFFAGPAGAFDLLSLPQVFVENFQDELSSPTTPELDLLGTSGLTVDGTLNGNAAHLMVDLNVLNALDIFTLLDPESVSTYGSDTGFRAEFENFSLASDGTASLLVGANFKAVGTGSLSQIVAGVRLTTDSGFGDFATLFIHEFDFNDPSNPLGTSEVVLATSDATAILSGAKVRIDLFIDNSSQSVVAEIEINDVPTSVAFLSLVDYDQQTLELAFYSLVNFLNGFPAPTEVDLILAEARANVQPLSFEPLFNIDIGVGQGTASNDLAAAGGPGEWNPVDSFGTLPVVDVSGLATGVSATLSAVSIVILGSPQPGLAALLGDSSTDCTDPDEWSFVFNGLIDGVYRVIVYAPADPDFHTGDISINGQLAIASLPGVSPAALVEGVSWDSTLGVVNGGSLSIEGLGNGSVSCAGIAGIQLERGTPIILAPSVPAFGAAGLLGLVSLLLVIVRRWAT
jgi:hypothetical protein